MRGSKIKGHFLVEMLRDWTLKPKSGCHAEEYSMWPLEESRSKESQLIRELPKYPLKVEKTEQVCVIQLSEMLLFTVTHLSLLFCLIHFNLGP